MLTTWSFGPSLINVKDRTDELSPSNLYIYLPDLFFFKQSNIDIFRDCQQFSWEMETWIGRIPLCPRDGFEHTEDMLVVLW